MSRHLLRFLMLSAFIFPVRAVGNPLDVSAWSLATGVGDASSGVSQNSEVVINPYLDEHHLTLGSSQAASFFDFSWTPDTASFLIAASNTAFDGNGGTRSISTGNIYLTPQVDLLITATGMYDYELPAWAMQVAHGLDIFVDSSHPYSWGDSQDTFLQGPISGTFRLSKQGILPAGSSVTISYAMHVDGFGNSGLLAEGAGDILITLQPVPEPQMFALFALAACLLRRKASRRRLCRGLCLRIFFIHDLRAPSALMRDPGF